MHDLHDRQAEVPSRKTRGRNASWRARASDAGLTVRRVRMVVPDLFFAARIEAVARASGVALETGPPEAALAACRAAPPDLLVLDLHAAGDPLALVRALKADAATRAIEIVGFYSHVDRETRAAAERAGVDRVLPRSAFTVRLPELLRGS